MAVVDRTAVVSLIKELSDDSILQKVRSCQDEEFLFYFIFFIRERQSHVHIENYFERIKLIYIRVIFGCQELQSAVWNAY